MRLTPTRSLLACLAMLACAPARADDGCEVGDVCVIQSPLFGCKDDALIKRWIALYVDENREAAERFISDQAIAGQCARFNAGDQLHILRYLGMRRIEARRPGDRESFIVLLK